MTAPIERRRDWRPAWPCPADEILGRHRRGAGDPTYRITGPTHWRGVRTPEGAATLSMRLRPDERLVELRAWGSGADWILEASPAMLGDQDDLDGFAPQHPVLIDVLRRHPHRRIGRTSLVMESLVPTVIEQKVTGQEAFAGFRRLVRSHGEAAPGPGQEVGLMLQPRPAQIAQLPSWEWLRLHIDPGRSRPLVLVCDRAASLERVGGGGLGALDRALRSLPGVGRWTSAEVRARALGDPDAVSFGDYHVASEIGYALTGEPVDDHGLEKLLEPWRGHRFRVQDLVSVGVSRRPRRGPRMPPRRHLPSRDVDR